MIQKTIKTIHSLTQSVYERLMQIQDNFQKIITLSSQWIILPLYSREKQSKFIMFGDRLTEIKIARCMEVQDASIKIQQLLKDDILLFHDMLLVDPNRSKFNFKFHYIFISTLIIVL